MVAAMMLPSTAPLLGLFVQASARQKHPGRMVAGYLAVWSLFGCSHSAWLRRRRPSHRRCHTVAVRPPLARWRGDARPGRRLTVLQAQGPLPSTVPPPGRVYAAPLRGRRAGRILDGIGPRAALCFSQHVLIDVNGNNRVSHRRVADQPAVDRRCHTQRREFVPHRALQVSPRGSRLDAETPVTWRPAPLSQLGQPSARRWWSQPRTSLPPRSVPAPDRATEGSVRHRPSRAPVAAGR